ncbi:MAG: RNase adapter RapZ [Nitrospirae bacterium CG_4_10_14_3_um_filter_53_41]|nr:MAG: RNase adapter RapZ [Nitrospirae bacterium CG17_big_fil_post_rev_8_21_14_2_50_50_9]PIX84678.1 MAG: RNase adapter RapZ [Nitrospirae bacterium CG_4_10_14_3_um_filter_53_41]
MMKKQTLKLAIISGISGSGKSTTIHQFEDMGFFCVDNIPMELIPKFLELCVKSGSEIEKVAVVVDIREKKFLKRYNDVLSDIRKNGFEYQVLFLDASDEVLLRRFKETRRRHPLAETSVLEGLALEREMLADVKASSDLVIDTSDYSIHGLRDVLRKQFESTIRSRRISISLVAFGFKYGIVYDADMIFDLRFLPNPFFVDTLRDRTGKDPEVVRYVFDRKETQEYLTRFYEFLDYLLPLFVQEGKSYLTLGFGCTGGRHRSVVVVDNVKKHLEEKGYKTSVRYRDIERR